MEKLEDTLAQRLLDEKGVDEVQRLAEEQPEIYLNLAALARHYLYVENAPRQAMRMYEEMQRLDGVRVPGFYKFKWAMLAAGFPEREAIAYRTMREVLPELRRKMTPAEEAVLRPLEERLNIPDEARIFKSKKAEEPPQVE